MHKFIAYFRRSKKEQASNLGLDAQLIEVENYIKQQKHGALLETFVELESGTRSKLHKRTVIWDAINACKKHDATLVIAKLDRLARDVEFISCIMNSGISFVACDIPQANQFTIHVMAAVAEQEAKRISERTKASLNALKAKGVKLGYHTHKNNKECKFTQEHRLKAYASLRKIADDNHNNRVGMAYAFSMYAKGLSMNHIVQLMNENGYKSSKGGPIHLTTVARWIKRKKSPKKSIPQS